MQVVVLDDYQRRAADFAAWESLGCEVEFVHNHVVGDVLVEILAGADVVVAMRERTPFGADLLERLPDLRLLVTTGAANASIDVAAAQRLGITVCGTRSLPGPAAELTWALILGLLRQLPAAEAGIRAGGWQNTIGFDLAGRTLGLVGLGRLGSRVARVGLAFEMEVLAWSQNLDPEAARAQGVTPVSQDELLARSDVVSLHLKLSDRTRGIIGAEQLRAMRPTAYLVNTSRGPLVDEDALLAALHGGWIAGAALDVYDEEPLREDHPLRWAPRTLLTPHLGYVSTGTYEVMYRDAVEDVAAWMRGEPVRVLNG